jgi:toxin-antitoxin system PIN domain toxin
MTPRRIALLDVNVLVALFFADHVHHDLAHDWFEDHRRDGWATCPVTENGFVRVACRQTSSDGPLRPSAAIKLLTRFCTDSAHHTWTDDVSLTDASLFAPQFIRGHGQITDVYLLGLAKRNGGYLATFDRSIPVEAVRGASRKTLAVISAAE